MLHDIEIACPYCGETFETLADCSLRSQRYYEDCQVCCAPILFFVEGDETGSLLTVDVKRDDE